jgi:hypothetical protein
MMPNRTVEVKLWHLLGVFLAIVLATTIAVALVDRESEARAREDRKLINANQALIRGQIKDRAEITYSTCLDQNARNMNTLRQLDNLIERRKRDVRTALRQADSQAEREALLAQITNLDASRTTTASLIDALQPQQNCEVLVKERFGFIPELGKPSSRPAP